MAHECVHAGGIHDVTPSVMQPSTIRRKAGDGVILTRLFWTLEDAPRLTPGRSRATFELAQQTTANEIACPYRKLSLA
jgi:hypothetical protein